MVSLVAEEIQNLQNDPRKGADDQRVPHILCLVSNRVQEADWRLATLGIWQLSTWKSLCLSVSSEFVFPQQ